MSLVYADGQTRPCSKEATGTFSRPFMEHFIFFHSVASTDKPWQSRGGSDTTWASGTAQIFRVDPMEVGWHTHTHKKFKSKVKFFFLVDGGRLRKKNVLFTEVIHLGRPHVTGRIWPGADTRHNFPERPALSGDADRVVRREPRKNGGNLVSVAPLFFEAKSDGFLGRKREKRIRCHQPWSVVARWLVQVMNGRLQRWRHLTVLIFLSCSLSVALVDFQTRKCVPLSCGPVGGHFEFETRCRETRFAGDGTRRGP